MKRFLLSDIFASLISISFNILRHHFLMIFWFCTAILIQCGICIFLKRHIQVPVHTFQCPMSPYCPAEQFDILTKTADIIPVFLFLCFSLSDSFFLHPYAFQTFPLFFLVHPRCVFCLIILSYLYLAMRLLCCFLITRPFL